MIDESVSQAFRYIFLYCTWLFEYIPLHLPLPKCSEHGPVQNSISSDSVEPSYASSSFATDLYTRNNCIHGHLGLLGGGDGDDSNRIFCRIHNLSSNLPNLTWFGITTSLISKSTLLWTELFSSKCLIARYSTFFVVYHSYLVSLFWFLSWCFIK